MVVGVPRWYDRFPANHLPAIRLLESCARQATQARLREEGLDVEATAEPA